MRWFTRWFTQRRREDDLDRELRSHLEQEAELQQDSNAARRAFGNLTLTKEDTRAAWGWTWIERAGQDLRYAARVLRRRPGFTAAAVLSLALGIGANTALFSLLDAILLRSLPVDRPHELVRLAEGARDNFTYQNYDELRRGNRLLEGLMMMTFQNANPLEIRDGGERRDAFVQRVSGNYFEVLGVRLARGRVFQENEGLAVISDAYWRKRYGADANAIGARFQIRNREYAVVGIAPPGFHGVEIDYPSEIWTPFEEAIPAKDRVGRWLKVMGRLRPGSTRAAAEAEASAVIGRAIQFEPGAIGYSNLRRSLLRPLLLLELIVGLVLLVTCANLANLMMAGAASREREIIVRQAIGASRGRLVRQLFTESLVLSAAGGTLALLAARWMSAALLSFLPPDQSLGMSNLKFTPDLRLIGFAIGVSFLTCLWFGLVPSLRATREHAGSIVRAGAGSEHRYRGRLSQGLLVSEIAMCTLLLMVAGVFVRSLQNLRGQYTGYQERGVLVADIQQPREYTEARRDQIIEEIRQRAAGLPGVQVAAFSHQGQLSGGAFEYKIKVPNAGIAGDASEQRISPGFLDAMGTQRIAGRDFAATDDTNARSVAMVNEAFARRFFPGVDAIGRRFMKEGGSRKFETIEIVGLVRDSKWINLREEPAAMYYVPYRQQGGTPVVRLAIRASGNLNVLATALLQTAQSIDRQIVLRNLAPFSEIVDRTLVIERLVAQVSAGFGILAVLIAGVGLYGVLAYNVVRRRREIGVRIAIGATPGVVQWMVVRESLALLGIGFAIGVPGAIMVTRLVQNMLFGLTPQDPVTIVAALAVLAGATTAAAYLPARRAAGTDPILALREE